MPTPDRDEAPEWVERHWEDYANTGLKGTRGRRGLRWEPLFHLLHSGKLVEMEERKGSDVYDWRHSPRADESAELRGANVRVRV